MLSLAEKRVKSGPPCLTTPPSIARRTIMSPSFKTISTRIAHWLGIACLRAAITTTIIVSSPAQDILVEGVENHGGYADQVSFRVPAQEGYDYLCRLDGQPVPAGVQVTVSEVNYHELFVQRSKNGATTSDSTNIQFIVRSSARGNTEFGLPPWTPYPVVDAGPALFEGLSLRLVAPSKFPKNFPVPVIALLEYSDDQPAWQNGMATLSGIGAASIQLRRGYGSRLMPPPSNAEELTCQLRLQSLQTARPVFIETDTRWTTVSGPITGSVVWPEHSRIFLDRDLDIAKSASLTIGAGSVVKIGPLANISVIGRFEVRGSLESPVIFMPDDRSRPWGGFFATNNTSEIEMTGTILTGGGGKVDYFSNTAGLSHRMEQPVVLLANGSRASLTNCYFIDNAGQMGNSSNATLSLDHCLVQRCVTAGQFNSGSITINRSALIEFPVDTPVFADADEDALYFKFGNHEIRNSVIGWTRDDGLDAILGAGETILITNCWFESCFHEAMAWSGNAGTSNVRQTVVLNCGQGMEAGWCTEPLMVFADNVVCVGNLVGARFGDNYNWGYAGFLRVTNSILVYNQRDVWGMNWQDWQYRASQMDIRNNILGSSNAFHPDNRLWNPQSDGWQLASFMPGPPDRPVGVAFAARNRQMFPSQIADGIPVGLSSFSTQYITVDYVVENTTGVLERGQIEFAPGETVKTIHPVSDITPTNDLVMITLDNPRNAQLTGWPNLFFARTTTPPAPRLDWIRSQGGLVLVWTDPGSSLYESSDMQGPWTTVKDATSPMTPSTTNANRFFRLGK